jgi:hypothetical protein
MNEKTPDLKLKYAQGFGDVIACFLHSAAIGWLTHLITGTDEPCTKCSVRRHALNALFPIKVWRIFFKDENEYLTGLSQEYKNLGYEVEVDYSKGVLHTNKTTLNYNTDNQQTITPTETQNLIQDDKFTPNDTPETASNKLIDNIDDYRLVSSSNTKLGDYMIRTQYFKKK